MSSLSDFLERFILRAHISGLMLCTCQVFLLLGDDCIFWFLRCSKTNRNLTAYDGNCCLFATVFLSL